MSANRFKAALLIAAIAAMAALAGVLLTGARPNASAASSNAPSATAKPAHPAGPPAAGRFFGRGGPGCGALAPGLPRGPAFDGAYGFGFACGDTGTVTQISGGTLTLRTLTGSVMVNTTSSTTYSKEGHPIALSGIHVNDVVRVRGARPSGTPTPPASPPTTITAQAITVVMPTFAGRVVTVQGPTIFIVTGDGQMAYVYTTAATSYSMNGAASTLTAIVAGDYVAAEGTQTDLTHLTADDVTIGIAPHLGRHLPGGPFPSRPSPTPSGTAA